jgi:hypothetical protein
LDEVSDEPKPDGATNVETDEAGTENVLCPCEEKED